MTCLYGDYFGFDPESDADAALKFSLECLLSDGRIASLNRLITDGHEVSALEGEPGWFVERRSVEELVASPQGTAWPNRAKFRAYVDPEAYELAFPEAFVSMHDFYECLRSGLIVYIERATDPSDAKNLLERISK